MGAAVKRRTSFLARKQTTLSGWASEFFFYVLLAYLVGATLGQINKATTGFSHDVFTLHGDYREAGIVMITSRYVALYRDGHSLVLPVSDITRIEERPHH